MTANIHMIPYHVRDELALYNALSHFSKLRPHLSKIKITTIFRIYYFTINRPTIISIFRT